MKGIKTLLTTLAVAALLVVLPESSTLTVNAAEAKNYAVQFCSDYNKGEWRYQEDSSFDEDKQHREIYYLLQDLKDGDKIAVYNEDTGADALDLGSAKLGELTFCNTAMTVVYTGGISNCNVLAGSSCSVNGNVDNAHVYDVSAVTFTGNVTELIATANESEFDSNIGCQGTVGHFHAYSINQPKSFHNIYNVAKGKLEVSDGNLVTSDSYFDRNGTVNTNPAPAPATPAPAAPGNSGSSGEYDSVPKTGDRAFAVCLLALTASALCFAGSAALKKSDKKKSDK